MSTEFRSGENKIVGVRVAGRDHKTNLHIKMSINHFVNSILNTKCEVFGENGEVFENVQKLIDSIDNVIFHK